MPVTERFTFTDPADFEARAKAIVLRWLPQLGGKTFHVRMHRRGSKGELNSHVVEQSLDAALLVGLAARGTPGRIDFVDPDAVIAVETIGVPSGARADARGAPSMNPRVAVVRACANCFGLPQRAL